MRCEAHVKREHEARIVLVWTLEAVLGEVAFWDFFSVFFLLFTNDTNRARLSYV